MMAGKLRVKTPVFPLLAVGAALVILLLGLAFSARPVLFAAYLLALCLLYLLFGYGRILVMCLLIFIPLGLVTGAVSLVVKSDWPTALATLGRVLLLGLSAITLVSTPPVNLTRCMTGLNMPRFLTLGMLVTIRFVPILAGEARRVREAMRTRGVNVAWYNLGGVYRAFLIPFIMQLINLSDLLAVSVETRAFSLAEKGASVYKSVSFTPRDGLFSLGLLLISGATVAGMVML